MPPGSLPYVLPVYTTIDGNCFPRSKSHALFGYENCHLEIRLQILIEGVKNKSQYLDDDFLKNGATHVHPKGTFPQQCALFSSQYFPPSGHFHEIIETIHEKEMLAIKNVNSWVCGFCGLQAVS